MNEPKGYLTLVLHAHLPYVRHPEFNEFMEESWLFEAITETYIPLLKVFERARDEGIYFRITMSLTPTLVSMLNDSLLRDRYEAHLNKLVTLGEREVKRTSKDSVFNPIAREYLKRFKNTLDYYCNVCGRDLVSRFADLQNSGHLEIITCAATHAFLPLLLNQKARRAQIMVAADHYEKNFGRRPRGIWLPECGYTPGVEDDLKEAGINFFFLDTHGILYAEPRPRFGVFAPILCPNGTAAFGRDVESSKQVWSAKEGYPGDYDYRDFYRDIGFDLSLEEIGDFIHPDGIRVHTGYKYYRITGPTDHKEPYNFERALHKADEHAGHFLFCRCRQAEYLHGLLGRAPVVTAPYDAELFGHWWFEGPDWLNFLIRRTSSQEIIKMITPSEYLAMRPTLQICEPTMSTWGWKGYNEVWLEGSNDWIYKHLLNCADRMCELASRHDNPYPLTRRALNQAARELFLAQASDWAFIMKTGTTVPYAVKRTLDHTGRFDVLYRSIMQENIDENVLCQYESADNIFPDIDYRVFR